MRSKNFSIITGTAVLALSCLALLFVTQTGAAAPKLSDDAERASNAGAVLGEIMAAPDQDVPEALLRRAVGIAVFPHVVKGALGVGGQFGKGLVTQKNADGSWGAPLYVEISGGSFGLQLGVQATDIILVFTNHDGIQPLLKGKLKLGADASIAAGPVGRKASVGTDILLKSAIFSYSRSKGLFAGVSLDGSVISIDDSANENVYGKSFSSAKVSASKATTTQMETVGPFIVAVQKYVNRSESAAKQAVK
jgi:lipid-binding SYLF domain-containing protein